MNQDPRAVGCNTTYYYGQFILTAEDNVFPSGWTLHEYGLWRLATLELSVIDVFNENQQWLGWCIGHPIVDGCLQPRQIVLQKTTSHAFHLSIEDFYQRASGKWILFLLKAGTPQVYLDAYGSLSLVYAIDEKTAASPPSLLHRHCWNEALIQAVGLPENDIWLPSGLTTKKMFGGFCQIIV